MLILMYITILYLNTYIYNLVTINIITISLEKLDKSEYMIMLYSYVYKKFYTVH